MKSLKSTSRMPIGPLGPWVYLESHRDERTMGQPYDGWYYKARKTPRPPFCHRGTMITVKSWGRAVRGKGTVTAIANAKAS